MAPKDNKRKKEDFTAKDRSLNKVKKAPFSVKKKRKWIPEHKIYQGSVQEGQGFAFQRKQKVQHEYNKLLRKQRNPQTKDPLREEFPEHLKHLYAAEAEKMSKEARENRMKRSRQRMGGGETDDADSFPVSNRMKKKTLRKTSFQKTREEFERIREKRRTKKEEFLQKQRQKEEAVKKYKQRKTETYKMLSKKTKKGQPNLNFQMEFLLQKIQESRN